jgi:hypothetical protein
VLSLAVEIGDERFTLRARHPHALQGAAKCVDTDRQIASTHIAEETSVVSSTLSRHPD